MNENQDDWGSGYDPGESEPDWSGDGGDGFSFDPTGGNPFGGNLNNPSLNPDWADPSQQQQNQFELDSVRDQNNYFGVGERGLDPSVWSDPGRVMGGNFRFMDSPADWFMGKANYAANNPLAVGVNAGLGMIPGFGQVSNLNYLAGLMNIWTIGDLTKNTFAPNPNQLGPGYTTVASRSPGTKSDYSTPNTFDPGYPNVREGFGSDPFFDAATQQSMASLNPAPAPAGLSTKDWGSLTFDPASNQFVYSGA